MTEEAESEPSDSESEHSEPTSRVTRRSAPGTIIQISSRKCYVNIFYLLKYAEGIRHLFITHNK